MRTFTDAQGLKIFTLGRNTGKIDIALKLIEGHEKAAAQYRETLASMPDGPEREQQIGAIRVIDSLAYEYRKLVLEFREPYLSGANKIIAQVES